MLTPKDLENPARKSGYNYVGYAVSNGDNSHPTGSRHPFIARTGGGHPERVTYWQGTRRATALESAQDYCDYVNSGKAPPPKQPKVPSPPKPALNLTRAKHPVRRSKVTEGPKTTEHRIARARVRRNVKQGFVYLIGVTSHADYVKIGWSAKDGFARLNELQTGNPLLLVGLAEKPGTLQDEYNLHARYEVDNVLNEWFKPTLELLAEFDYTWTEFCVAVGDVWAIEKEAV